MDNLDKSGTPAGMGLTSDQCNTSPTPNPAQAAARSTIMDNLKREQHDLIERLAQVHKAIKEVDNIPEENLKFFLRNRYRL